MWTEILGENSKKYAKLRFSEAKDKGGNSEYYSGNLTRLKLSYQFSRDIAFKTLVQNNEFSSPSLAVQSILSYQPNPFTIVYAGISQDGDSSDDGMIVDSRYLFFKFQYLLK